MARPEKELVVNEVAESLSKAKGIYVTDFSGLNVEDMNELRKAFRASAVQYRVVKNTLARQSVSRAGYAELLAHLNGPTAFAFSYDNASIPARIIRDFLKKKEKPVVKALVFEGVVFDSTRLEEIANLPSREVMISKLMGAFNAPLTKFVCTLQGIISKFVRTLNAIAEQKEG